MASIKKTAVAFGTILTFISQGTEGQTLASATAAASAHKLGKVKHKIRQSFLLNLFYLVAATAGTT